MYICLFSTAVRVRAECDWCDLSAYFSALCNFIHCCWKADWQSGKACIFMLTKCLSRYTLENYCSTIWSKLFVQCVVRLLEMSNGYTGKWEILRAHTTPMLLKAPDNNHAVLVGGHF